MSSAANLPDLSGFTYAGPGYSPPDATNTASGSTGDQGILSGLSDLFSAVGAGVSSGLRTSQTGQQIRTPSGTLVYNPATGQYVSAQGVVAQGTMSPLIVILGLGLIFLLLMRK